MVSVRAIGVMLNDPQRGHVALHALRDVVTLPAGTDGVGVATCVDGAVLVSRRPLSASDDGIAPLVGPLKGRCAVVRIRGVDELRPPRSVPSDIGPFRVRSFACAVVGGPQTADEATVVRDRLLADLPDFLRRSVSGDSEGETFFFAVLAHLHQSGQLERGLHASPEAVVESIRATLEKAGPAPRHVTMATGTHLVHVASGVENALIRLDGLAAEVADDIDPTLADSSIGKERLRRFRGVFALGALNEPFEDTRNLPKGATLLRHPPHSAVFIGRELEPKTL